MNDLEYLQAILKSQDLPDDSTELKSLMSQRKLVEEIIRKAFPNCAPTIRYGGAKVKGTLIREAYDLDITCYFACDDEACGSSLADIYNNIFKVLEKGYAVIRKRSALRLHSKQAFDFHIDVVPGRFIDANKGDCYLHQETGDKERLKTNLDVHINYVRDSGRIDAIRVLKLWKNRKNLSVKQFVFELLIIKLLKGSKKSLPDQVKYVWATLRDAEDVPTIEDPANPEGNDLSGILKEEWKPLVSEAAATLSLLEAKGWEAVFGKIPTNDNKTTILRTAAANVIVPTRPWCAE